MSELKRYNLKHGEDHVSSTCSHPNGEYVKFKDFQSQLAEKDKEIAELRAALEFYADIRSYNIRHVAVHVDGFHAGISSDVHFDGGKRARQALQNSKTEG